MWYPNPGGPKIRQRTAKVPRFNYRSNVCLLKVWHPSMQKKQELAPMVPCTILSDFRHVPIVEIRFSDCGGVKKCTAHAAGTH